VRGTISIIIPTLNEERAIAETLNSIPRSELNAMGYTVEVVVVDGESQDRTRELAAAAGAKVIVEPRKGYGIPIRTGIYNSDGDIIVKADGDGTYPLERLPELVQLFEEEKLDFLSTDRMTNLDHHAMSTRNRLGNKILLWLVLVLFRLKVKDSQSGMWIITRRAFHPLILETNVTFSQELKVEAMHFARLRYDEVPISYRGRQGKAKFGTIRVGLHAALALLHLRFRLRHSRPMTASGQKASPSMEE